MIVSHLATPLSSEHPESSLLLESVSVGRVGLIVSDLQRSLEFYTGVIGLDVLMQTSQSAQLGVLSENHILLELEQRGGVRPLRSKRLGL